LEPFQVLVGPNATGKTTFLDVPLFLADLVSEGLQAAVDKRTSNFKDLLWLRQGDRLELAVEAAIPEDRRKRLINPAYDTLRYEVALGIDGESGEVRILAEKALIKVRKPLPPPNRSLFPALLDVPSSIMSRKGLRVSEGKLVLNKTPGRNDNYYSESYREAGKGWMPSVKLGPRKSTLGNLPEDESNFPALTWFKEFLRTGVQQFMLNSLALRKASPPGQIRGFKPDGTNLPWVVDNLLRKSPERHKEWVKHLRTALPDLEDIQTVEREDDRHRYLTLQYTGNLKVPSWMVSDGTLRLLALALPAYLTDFQGVYLIEEPENGIHPKAMETAYQSLSSVYDAQILLATHSPVILSMVEADKVLCFGKTSEGATDIVPGHRHPKLKDWKGEPNLSVLFAAGILG
jgi:predicted ATPase